MKPTRTVLYLLAMLRVGLGLFFLYTSLSKVSDLAATADFMTRSRVLPEFFSMPLSCIGVSMEIVVALCLISKSMYRGASLWLVIMCGVFVVLFAQAWIRGLDLSCNCTGSLQAIENYPLEVSSRCILLAAGALLLWDAWRSEPRPWKSRPFDFSDAG